MSEVDDKTDELTEIKNILKRCNKNIKELMTMVKSMDEQMNQKPADKDDKEKIDKMFEKKQIGRPVGSYESKQEQYVKILNDDKIKQPKEQSLEYYKIVKVGDKYSVID